MAIYGFDTTDEHAATAALLVYAVYRSRDRTRYKASPDMWEQIERFTKDAAKRARTLPAFIEALKPRLACGSIRPRWMAVGLKGEVPILAVTDPDTGALKYAIQPAAAPDQREFLTEVFDRADAREVVQRLYRETAWVILLVRDRLEREKPVEARIEADDEDSTTDTLTIEHKAA